MSQGLNAAQNFLAQVLPEVQSLLNDFITGSDFNSQINLAFGMSASEQGDDVKNIISQWLAEENILHTIEIVPSTAINGALGAYAAENNTIYLSEEFLIQNFHNPEAVENVLLEELGHAFSAQVNPEDAPGDEGAIFRLLVRGQVITPETLAQLQGEDDTVEVTLNNQNIQIEQATAGINPAFDLIGLTDLRNDPNFADIDGTGFDVVIIDSGLDQTHPLLDDNYRAGFDFIDDDSDPNDLQNHGTHVSGIIGAEDENIGVAPDVGLIGLKVGEDEDLLDGEAVNEALQLVLDQVTNPDSEFNIAAVNLSLSEPGFFTDPDAPNLDIERRLLIQELEAAGVVVVASAGNRYGDNQVPNLSAPAIYSTIAVGAVWQDNSIGLYTDIAGNSQIPGEDRIALFSQRLDADNFLFAPGAFITSTVPEEINGELFDSFPGTSQAAPHVAGAVALLQEIAAGYGIRLSPEQVRDYLISNADLVTDEETETDTVTNTGLSYPRINIHQSAIALRNDLENNALTDDLLGGATNLTLNDRQPLIFSGILEQDNGIADVDLYRITIPDDGSLQIDIDTPYVTDFPDTYLRLFNEDGAELFFSNNNALIVSDDDLAPGEVSATVEFTDEIVIINDENTTDLIDGFRTADSYQPGNYGHITDSYLSFSGEAGETYYIGVSDFSNQEYDPTNLNNRPAPLSTDGGQYELITTFFSSDSNNSGLNDSNDLDDSVDAVYRFFRPDVGVHFYTANPEERDAILTNLPNFDFEGVSYQSVDLLSGSSNVTPVYRLLNRDTGVHLYTNSEVERDVVTDLPNYTFEGEAFHSYTAEVQGSIPIHRFYNPTVGAHFYTPVEAEREAVETGLPDYQYEGIAYYALPAE